MWFQLLCVVSLFGANQAQDVVSTQFSPTEKSKDESFEKFFNDHQDIVNTYFGDALQETRISQMAVIVGAAKLYTDTEGQIQKIEDDLKNKFYESYQFATRVVRIAGCLGTDNEYFFALKDRLLEEMTQCMTLQINKTAIYSSSDFQKIKERVEKIIKIKDSISKNELEDIINKDNKAVCPEITANIEAMHKALEELKHCSSDTLGKMNGVGNGIVDRILNCIYSVYKVV